jgi:hypothetical protein
MITTAACMAIWAINPRKELAILVQFGYGLAIAIAVVGIVLGFIANRKAEKK